MIDFNQKLNEELEYHKKINYQINLINDNILSFLPIKEGQNFLVSSKKIEDQSWNDFFIKKIYWENNLDPLKWIENDILDKTIKLLDEIINFEFVYINVKNIHLEQLTIVVNQIRYLTKSIFNYRMTYFGDSDVEEYSTQLIEKCIKIYDENIEKISGYKKYENFDFKYLEPDDSVKISIANLLKQDFEISKKSDPNLSIDIKENYEQIPEIPDSLFSNIDIDFDINSSYSSSESINLKNNIGISNDTLDIANYQSLFNENNDSSETKIDEKNINVIIKSDNDDFRVTSSENVFEDVSEIYKRNTKNLETTKKSEYLLIDNNIDCVKENKEVYINNEEPEIKKKNIFLMPKTKCKLFTLIIILFVKIVYYIFFFNLEHNYNNY